MIVVISYNIIAIDTMQKWLRHPLLLLYCVLHSQNVYSFIVCIHMPHYLVPTV